MIRFHDTAEKKDDSELLSPSAFQDIKPSGTMSSEEAISFLDGLFSVEPESQDTYSIDEESLLAEIFGRFEDEFDFDFELDDDLGEVPERGYTTLTPTSAKEEASEEPVEKNKDAETESEKAASQTQEDDSEESAPASEEI